MKLADLCNLNIVLRRVYRFWWFGRVRCPLTGRWVESDKSLRKRIMKDLIFANKAHTHVMTHGQKRQ
jgi:hypothetical protein